MDQLSDISLLIVNSNFWLILGIILIIFEVFFIGTMVFILPIGLASILNGIIFFILNTFDIINIEKIHWFLPMISLSFFSFLFLFSIQYFLKKNKTKNNDINEY